MTTVRACALPPEALLLRYRERGYIDCYQAEVPVPVSHADYVKAFYTTAVFKAERLILAALSMPSTDAEVMQLAAGTRERFAAWTVEARAPDQLLLRAADGATRSWLMTDPLGGGRPGTRLYFGSAVVAKTDPATGISRMGTTYRALLGFHRLYSRILLSAARRRLMRRAPSHM